MVLRSENETYSTYLFTDQAKKVKRKHEHAYILNSIFIVYVINNASQSTSKIGLLQVITKHDQSKPLFLYLPFQNPHFPQEVPSEYYDVS